MTRSKTYRKSIPLAELAEIHSGYSLRNPTSTRQESCTGRTGIPAEKTRMIQPQNIISCSFENLHEISVRLAKNMTVLQPDDVLLTGRMNFKAAIFSSRNYATDGQEQIKTLASAAIWIIRPKKDILNPGFLAFWLNSAYGQKILHSISSGFTTIKSIRKEDLENLSLSLPALHRQQMIGNMYMCHLRLKALRERQIFLQQQLIEAAAQIQTR